MWWNFKIETNKPLYSENLSIKCDIFWEKNFWLNIQTLISRSHFCFIVAIPCVFRHCSHSLPHSAFCSKEIDHCEILVHTHCTLKATFMKCLLEVSLFPLMQIEWPSVRCVSRAVGHFRSVWKSRSLLSSYYRWIPNWMCLVIFFSNSSHFVHIISRYQRIL